MGERTIMPDRYDLVRRDEHSTVSDSTERYRRDPDAFTAGVQHALDKIVSEIEMELYRTISPQMADYLVGRAADVLGRVHNGQLT